MKKVIKKDVIKLSLPNKPEYVSVARLTASSIANRAGFNIEQIDDIKVALGEVCTNAIQHGLKNEEKNYDIEFILYDDKLSISVKDTGTGKCSGEANKPNIDELRESGLGLFIIKAIMDEIECISNEGEGTEIRMIKRIGEDSYEYSSQLCKE